MESIEQFIGGVAIMFIATLLLSFFATSKKIGVWGAWGIGAGIGLIFSFLLTSNMGLLFGIVATIIAAIASPSSKANVPTNSIADELSKLENLRSTGVLNDEEFEQQKKKLLK